MTKYPPVQRSRRRMSSSKYLPRQLLALPNIPLPYPAITTIVSLVQIDPSIGGTLSANLCACTLHTLCIYSAHARRASTPHTYTASLSPSPRWRNPCAAMQNRPRLAALRWPNMHTRQAASIGWRCESAANDGWFCSAAHAHATPTPHHYWP
jgi:hypothetical protein